MLKIHPREERCRAAQNELFCAAIDIKKRHDLTEAEALRVVNEVLSSWVADVAKVSIRVERHGDPETPGGLDR